MKAKLTTLLKAIGIVLAIYIFAILVGALIHWSYYLHLSVVLVTIIAGIYYSYRTMRPKKRYYFVSFVNGGEFGCCTLIATDGLFRIKDASKCIREEHYGGVGTVVIIYYKELSKEEHYAQTKGGEE